jgi:site-specific recombinase XerD
MEHDDREEQFPVFDQRIGENQHVTELAPVATPLLPLAPGISADQDPYRVYLDCLDSNESKRTMGACLDRIVEIIYEEEAGQPLPQGMKVSGAGREWWRLRYKHTVRIRSLLIAKGWSAAHVNKHIYALRRVLEECWNLGLMSSEEHQRAAKIKAVKAQREPAGRDVHEDELLAMIRVCVLGDGPAAVRNAALVAVLHATGIRREEAARAQIPDYDPGSRSLRVIGKGNKQRLTFINPTAVPRLDAWLALLATRNGALFRPIDKWGNINARTMKPRAIGAIIDRVRTQAGLARLGPHDIRRTFTGDLLDAGVDLSTAQKLLGHSSPNTTSRYDRREERTLRDAADRIQLPSPESPLPTTTGARREPTESLDGHLRRERQPGAGHRDP